MSQEIVTICQLYRHLQESLSTASLPATIGLAEDSIYNEDLSGISWDIATYLTNVGYSVELEGDVLTIPKKNLRS